MKCPKCGEPCERDTVDVGVGEVPTGPWGCPACQWVEQRDEQLLSQMTELLTPPSFLAIPLLEERGTTDETRAEIEYWKNAYNHLGERFNDVVREREEWRDKFTNLERVAARDKEIADLKLEQSLADKATVAARSDRDRFQRELAITQEKLELALAGTNLDDAGLTAVIESIAERAMTAVASVAKEQIAEAQAALVSERAKCCGTCRWWSAPDAERRVSPCRHPNAPSAHVSHRFDVCWPADHGCPHHERKDGAA